MIHKTLKTGHGWQLREEGQKIIQNFRNNHVSDVMDTFMVTKIMRDFLNKDYVFCALDWRNYYNAHALNSDKIVHGLVNGEEIITTPLTSLNSAQVIMGAKELEVYHFWARELLCAYYRLLHFLVKELKLKTVVVSPQNRRRVVNTSTSGEYYISSWLLPNIHSLIYEDASDINWHGTFCAFKSITNEEVKITKQSGQIFTGCLILPKSDNIYIPPSFPFEGTIVESNFDTIPTQDSYKNIKEYNDRYLRMLRLRKGKEERDRLDKLKGKGYTNCLDNYGSRVRLGDIVCYFHGYMKMGEVKDCTAKSLYVEEISTGNVSCVSARDIIRV